MTSKTVNICSNSKNTPYKRPTSPIHLYTLLWMKHGLLNRFISRSAPWDLLVLLRILYVWFLSLKTSSLPVPLTDKHRREPKKGLMTFRTQILQKENLQNCYSSSYIVVWDIYIHPVNKEMSIKYWGSFEHASLIWNNVWDQLDATNAIYWYTISTTCFGQFFSRNMLC
jgi:hypothetical protein